MGPDLERIRRMISKIVQPAYQIALFYVGSEFDEGFPNAGARRWDVVFQIGCFDQAGRRGSRRIDLHDFSSQHAVVPENVLDAFVSVMHALEADGFSVAEFTANGDL